MSRTASFDPCTDGGPFDKAAYAAEGHHEPSTALLLCLGRAIRYEGGYGHAEVRGLLDTVRWTKGYSGEHPNHYDLVPCTVDGEALEDCDDDGEPYQCSHVRPCTWGEVTL